MGHRKLSLASKNPSSPSGNFSTEYYLFWFIKNKGYREPLKSRNRKDKKKLGRLFGKSLRKMCNPFNLSLLIHIQEQGSIKSFVIIIPHISQDNLQITCTHIITGYTNTHKRIQLPSGISA